MALVLKSLKELKVTGRRVLVRAGYDIADDQGKLEDDFRIKASLPTLNFLIRAKAKIVIISHRGRPKGWDQALSMGPVARELAELLKRKLLIIGPDTKHLPDYSVPHLYFFTHNLENDQILPLLEEMRGGDVGVLENLRFYAGEQTNDEKFAEILAGLGEAYVNDAFSVCHRAHASVAALARLLPAAAGLGLVAEITALEQVTNHPKKPVVVMMGGVKLSDKAVALENLAKFSDHILLGGGLANLFLKVKGFEIGKSVWEEKSESGIGRELWRNFKDKIHLPVDVIVSYDKDGEPEWIKADKVKKSQLILDIGPETIRLYSKYLKEGQTLIWAGPMGYFENKAFSHGTFALAWLLASRSAAGRAFSVAGGGQTLEVVKKLNLATDISFVSTGGGAMLDFLAGKTLPGLEVLKQN